MPDPNIRDAIRNLVETHSDASVGSIDYVTNAKAIALKAEIVIAKLTELLSAGYRLKSMEPVHGFASLPPDFRLRFHLESDNVIDLPTSDFVIAIELTTKSVKRLMQPDEAVASSTIAAPFSLAVPSRATAHKIPASELTNKYRRARAFFESRLPSDADERLRVGGFARQPRSGVDTEWETPTTTEAWCLVDTLTDTGTRFSDSQTDVEADEMECNILDSEIDSQVDIV